MAWYETQIFGVIIGASAVFAYTQVDRIIQRRKAKENLKAAMQSEVSVLVDFMEDGLKWIRLFRKEWEDGKILRRWQMGGEGKTPVIDSNLDKIGLLDSLFIRKIVEFRGLIDTLNPACGRLQNAIDRAHEGESSVALLETIKLQTRIIESSFLNLMELGKEITGEGGD